MRLRYTKRALADLSDISDYLTDRSPRGAARVIAAIESAMTNIATFPMMGRRQSTGSVRKAPVGRHPYNIVYVVDSKAGEISMLTSRHTARAGGIWRGSVKR